MYSLLAAVTFVLYFLWMPGNTYANPKGDFQNWLQSLRAEAIQRGHRPDIVHQLLTNIKPNRRVIKRDQNQAEFKLSLSSYMSRVITPTNIRKGRQKATDHHDLLAAVSQKYGVQSRFILAIWGIETRYGAVEGNVPIIPALATLAFDSRRSTFFKNQLFAVIKMVSQGYIDVASLFGSWAGAMGQPQFIPSSYLAFAQDFDGDGRRDIWNNTGDIFASIANYLRKNGWTADQTWGREVKVPRKLIVELGKPGVRAAPGCRARTSIRKHLSEWQTLGVRRINGSNLPSRNLPASLVMPDGENGSTFLVYSNYAAIMAYNCAHLYAVTVGILGDRIGAKK